MYTFGRCLNDEQGKPFVRMGHKATGPGQQMAGQPVAVRTQGRKIRPILRVNIGGIGHFYWLHIVHSYKFLDKGGGQKNKKRGKEINGVIIKK